MAETNWKRNERQAAAALGLATTEEKNEPEKVSTLDVELDDGGRVVLTITRRGSVSIQTYRACLKGNSLYALSGSGIIAPADVKEWAETLREKTAPQPCINALIQGSGTL